jgi:hypothetical protein
MNQIDKENAFDKFIQISNEVSKITNQYRQLQAHMEKYSAFFEELWTDGYNQGLKDGKKQHEVKISKSN